jgi:RNA polymerase sigma-70 factor, ECF subfamily
MRDITIADIERLRAEACADGAEAVFEMDEDAFRALYDRTSRALWAYLSRLTGSPDAADDLLQETYYRFLRAQGRYESEAHRRNSLFRIATNLARDGWRRDGHARLVPLPEGPRGELTATVDVAGDAQRRTDLSRALLQLTRRERAMLWLAYAHGSSHRDIASTVGVKTTSVKLLLFRARRKLAAVMRQGKSVTKAERHEH